MSQTTFSLTWRKNGALYDPTSVKFNSPAGVVPAYGVKRTDTNAIVIAAGTNFNRISTGIYQYTLTDPASGLTYDYWREVISDGQTFSNDFLKPGGGGIPTCKYCDYNKFLNHFGSMNVAQASNKDQTSRTPDPDAVQDSFDYAAGEVDAFFSSSIYKTPLDFSPNNSVIPTYVSRWTMDIAFADLYLARGIMTNSRREGSKVQRMLQASYNDMAMYRALIKQMPALVLTDSVGANLVEVPVIRTVDVFQKYGQYIFPDAVYSWTNYGALW